MTVSTTDSIQTFAGNGASVFPFGFRFLDNSHLVVTRINVYGDNTLLVLGPDYSVTGAGSQNGGSVILISPLLVGERLVVSRVMPIVQPTDLRNQGKYLAETQETSLDRLTMIAQQGDAQLSKAIRVPDSDPEPGRLPPAASRANKVMGFDNDGNPIGVLPASGSGTELAIDLANSADSAKGSGMIGHNGTTVREKLIEHDQQIVAAAERADSGAFGDSVMRTRILNSIGPNPPIYVLGDSISHGAFALDLYRNSWVNLFKRMINLDYGVTNYGYVPMMSLGSGPTLSTDIDQLTFTNTDGLPQRWSSRSGATGSYVPQGLSWVSTNVGDILRTQLPCFQRRAYVWYIANPGGGTFTVKVNGVLQATVNTASATRRLIMVQVIAMTADTFGDCTIECETTVAGASTPVELAGFSYVGQTNTLAVNNFSQSGRRLRWMDEETIQVMMQGTAMFVMALGYNDAADNLADPAYFAQFKQRIDWLIQYANLYEVPVVVPDFVWPYQSTDITRQELKRLATQTKGVYIPFPDYFSKAGATSNDYRVNTLKLFQDGAHPNVAGHKYIAETIAKRIGLSCTSKKEVLDRHDWWFPLRLQSTGVTSAGQNSDTISAVRNNGPMYELRLNIGGIAGNTARGIQAAWPTRAGIQQAFGSVHTLSQKTDGTSRGTFTIAAGGAITANPNAANDISSHVSFVSAPNADHGAV